MKQFKRKKVKEKRKQDLPPTSWKSPERTPKTIEETQY